MKTRLQNRFTRVDIAALFAFLVVWTYCIVMVRYGVSFPDEGSYLAMAEQFAHGGRPLVDEWHLSQLPSILLCLPYEAFAALTGGTDGVILFMRGLFLAFNAAFFWFMYIRLRAYRRLSLLAALLFCIYVPFGIFTCNYYSMPARLLMLVCLLLFAEKQTPPSLFAAGVLLSLAVIFQPGLALLYLGYSILVFARFLRQKKGGRSADHVFYLHTRSWKFLSLGVLVCAAVFSAWLIWRSGLRNILTSVPYLLFTDWEHDFSAQGSARGFFIKKVTDVVQIYGLGCILPAVLLLALSIAFACGKFRARRAAVQKSLFCLAGVLWIVSCVRTFRLSETSTPDSFFALYPAPFLWFGLVCFLLCTQRNKRLFAFWIVGLASSVCMDLFSNVALSMGSPISYIADLVFFTDLVRELRADPAHKERGEALGMRRNRIAALLRVSTRWTPRLICLCFAVWFGFTLLWENTFVPAHYLNGTPLPPFSYVCKDGPCRSLRVPQGYGQNYSDKLSDIDTLKKTQPKNLYICGLSPELYLYARLPLSTCSPYTFRTTSDLRRHVQYWRLHPQHLPECVYVPFDDPLDDDPEEDSTPEGILAWIRESFDPLCIYSLEQGKSGYILYVSSWDLTAGSSAQ